MAGRQYTGREGRELQMQDLDVLRTERKYRLSVVTAGRIRAKMSHCLELDANCRGQRPYVVRSLYFDTWTNRDYAEKSSGLENRQKIRLRTYGQGGVVKLEWKRKQGAKQRKQSLLIPPGDVPRFAAGDYRPLLCYDSELARQMYCMMAEGGYQPKCLVVYDRLAYVIPTNDIRITFDSHIAAREGNFDLLHAAGCWPVQSPGSVILEVKYNHFLLDYVQSLLAPFDLVESANSKYVQGRYFGLGGNRP